MRGGERHRRLERRRLALGDGREQRDRDAGRRPREGRGAHDEGGVTGAAVTTITGAGAITAGAVAARAGAGVEVRAAATSAVAAQAGAGTAAPVPAAAGAALCPRRLCIRL